MSLAHDHSTPRSPTLADYSQEKNGKNHVVLVLLSDAKGYCVQFNGRDKLVKHWYTYSDREPLSSFYKKLCPLSLYKKLKASGLPYMYGNRVFMKVVDARHISKQHLTHDSFCLREIPPKPVHLRVRSEAIYACMGSLVSRSEAITGQEKVLTVPSLCELQQRVDECIKEERRQLISMAGARGDANLCDASNMHPLKFRLKPADVPCNLNPSVEQQQRNEQKILKMDPFNFMQEPWFLEMATMSASQSSDSEPFSMEREAVFVHQQQSRPNCSGHPIPPYSSSSSSTGCPRTQVARRVASCASFDESASGFTSQAKPILLQPNATIVPTPRSVLAHPGPSFAVARQPQQQPHFATGFLGRNAPCTSPLLRRLMQQQLEARRSTAPTVNVPKPQITPAVTFMTSSQSTSHAMLMASAGQSVEMASASRGVKSPVATRCVIVKSKMTR